jgi:CRISPR/Cas system CSM-associated protein Csm3 (group 7 of RAMP superfamily)
MATNKIKYSITFLSDWHAGSGLSSGANADSIVIKDKHNFPYLPGKTIKGLLRDALEDIKAVQTGLVDETMMYNLFGMINSDTSTSAGSLHFSNVVLEEKAQISEEMTEFFYRNFASTTIEKNGVAKQGSLRTIEVTVPMTLHGEVSNTKEFQEKEIEMLKMAMLWTRSLGANRNRGLGRCQIQLID